MTFSSIRQTWYSRSISLCLMITFVTSMVITPRASYAQGVVGLPQPGTMVNLSPAYMPLMITGLTIHPENPLLMDFIVSTGNSGIKADRVKKESDRLIKYFLACLTIPDNNQWVNLSPYEKDRIIPDDLGQTVLGQDMLAQDYILKQLTASLIYPERNLGKNFWDKVYSKARQMYGTTQIPVNTFNKVWILPDTAKVYEHKDTVFVVKNHLTVMLDEDYLALNKRLLRSNATHTIASQIVRQIILPAIEEEVNTGKNFAQMRQIYNSMILAVWFKQNLKQALLNQVYTGRSKVNGVNVADPSIKEKIYQQYLQAYKKGVFNYIKEEDIPYSLDSNGKPQMIARKYFSGGLGRVTRVLGTTDPAMLENTVDSFPAADENFKLFGMTAVNSSAAMTVYNDWDEFLTAVQRAETEQTNEFNGKTIIFRNNLGIDLTLNGLRVQYPSGKEPEIVGQYLMGGILFINRKNFSSVTVNPETAATKVISFDLPSGSQLGRRINLMMAQQGVPVDQVTSVDIKDPRNNGLIERFSISSTRQFDEIKDIAYQIPTAVSVFYSVPTGNRAMTTKVQNITVTPGVSIGDSIKLVMGQISVPLKQITHVIVKDNHGALVQSIPVLSQESRISGLTKTYPESMKVEVTYETEGEKTISVGEGNPASAAMYAQRIKEDLVSSRSKTMSEIEGESARVLANVRDYLTLARQSYEDARLLPDESARMVVNIQIIQNIQNIIALPHMVLDSDDSRATADQLTRLWEEVGNEVEMTRVNAIKSLVKNEGLGNTLRSRMAGAHIVFEDGRPQIEDLPPETASPYSSEIWAPYLADSFTDLIKKTDIQLDAQGHIILPRTVGRFMIEAVQRLSNATTPIDRLKQFVNIENNVRKDPKYALQLAQQLQWGKIATRRDFQVFIQEFLDAMRWMKWYENWESKKDIVWAQREEWFSSTKSKLGLESMDPKVFAARVLSRNIPFEIIDQVANNQMVRGQEFEKKGDTLLRKGYLRMVSMAGGSASRWKTSLQALIDNHLIDPREVPDNLPRALAAYWIGNFVQGGETGVSMMLNNLELLNSEGYNVSGAYVLSPYTWQPFMKATHQYFANTKIKPVITDIAQNPGSAQVLSSEGAMTDQDLPGKVLGHGNVRGWLPGIIQALQQGNIVDVTRSADNPFMQLNQVQAKEIIGRMAEDGLVHVALGNWRNIGQFGGGFYDQNGIPNVVDTAIPKQPNAQGFLADRDISIFSAFTNFINNVAVLYAVSSPEDQLLTWDDVLAITRGEDDALKRLQQKLENLTPEQIARFTTNFINLLPSEYVEKKEGQTFVQWEQISGMLHGSLPKAIQRRQLKEGIPVSTKLTMAYVDISLADYRTLYGNDTKSVGRYVNTFTEVKGAPDLESQMDDVARTMNVMVERGIFTPRPAAAAASPAMTAAQAQGIIESASVVEVPQAEGPSLWRLRLFQRDLKDPQDRTSESVKEFGELVRENAHNIVEAGNDFFIPIGESWSEAGIKEKADLIREQLISSLGVEANLAMTAVTSQEKTALLRQAGDLRGRFNQMITAVNGHSNFPERREVLQFLSDVAKFKGFRAGNDLNVILNRSFNNAIPVLPLPGADFERLLTSLENEIRQLPLIRPNAVMQAVSPRNQKVRVKTKGTAGWRSYMMSQLTKDDLSGLEAESIMKDFESNNYIDFDGVIDPKNLPSTIDDFKAGGQFAAIKQQLFDILIRISKEQGPLNEENLGRAASSSILELQNRVADGTYKLKNPAKGLRVLVGYDGRPHADEYAKFVARVAGAYEGVSVDLADDLIATPDALQQSRRDEEYDLVLVLTASHNDYRYLGLKIGNDGGIADDDITGGIDTIANSPEGEKLFPILPQETVFNKVDLKAKATARYKAAFPELPDAVKAFLASKPNSVFVNFMHGSDGRYKEFFQSMGVPVENIHMVSPMREGKYPQKTIIENGKKVYWRPQPVREMLEDELKAFEENTNVPEGAVYLTIDGDADRFAVWQKLNGKMVKMTGGTSEEISPNEMSLMFLDYMIKNNLVPEGVKRIVITRPTGKAVAKRAKIAGYDVIFTPVGSKFLKKYMNDSDNPQATLVFEESGHGGFRIQRGGRVFNFFDDGLAQALFFLEIMTDIAKQGLTPVDYIRHIKQDINYNLVYRKIAVNATDASKDKIRNSLQAKPKPVQIMGHNITNVRELVGLIQNIVQGDKKYTIRQVLHTGANDKLVTMEQFLNDGVKLNPNEGLNIEFDTGAEDNVWIEIRMSGTEPIIRIYGQFEDQQQADRVMEIMDKQFFNAAMLKIIPEEDDEVTIAASNTITSSSSTTSSTIYYDASRGREIPNHTQTVSAENGGIDLNSRNLRMQSEGQKVSITFDAVMIARFRRGDFSGVRIQILDVIPISLLPLLGLT